MNIHLIILYLGLRVILIENNDYYACGSYYKDIKQVEINMKSNCDINETLYHEVGHALFLNDKEVKDLISKYPPPKYYREENYPTKDDRLNERVADYWAMFVKYPDFPKKFPEINRMFNSKINKLTK